MNSTIILITFFLYSCNERKGKSQIESITKVKNIYVDTITLKPDLTVNGLALLDDTSMQKITKKKIVIKEGIREAPVVIFLNKRNTQYLVASQYEGDVANYFSLFEIGYLKDELSLDSIGFKIQIDDFTTESGLKLGMTMEELLKIKGKEYSINQDGENITICYAINNPNDPLLKLARLPGYFIRVFLKNNVIYKIIFGFEYP